MRQRPLHRTHTGTHRRLAAEQQAANIVHSIRAHQARGIARTPADYQVSGELLSVVEQMMQQAA